MVSSFNVSQKDDVRTKTKFGDCPPDGLAMLGMDNAKSEKGVFAQTD